MNRTEIANMSDLSEFIGESAVATAKDGNCSYDSFKDYYFALAADINFYGLLIVIPFGLIGNIFSICVFLLSKILRCTTTGQFLIALAVADSTVLVGEAIRWLASRRHNTPEHYFPMYLGLNFVNTSNAACKINNFIRYGGTLWSVWLTIAISLERLIAVAFPLKIGQLSTPRRTRVVIACIGIVSFVLSSFSFWTLHADFIPSCGVNVPQCRIYDTASYNTWNTAVVKFCTVLIPGILIVILTAAIIAMLYRARYKRQAHLNASQKKQQNREGVARLEISMETQLTIMLVAVCISTIALRAPYTIAYYIRSIYWDIDDVDPVTEVVSYMAYRVTDVVNTVNYAINFILYCLCGSSFRREARKIFCKAQDKKNGRISSLVTEEICLSDMQRKSADNIYRA